MTLFCGANRRDPVSLWRFFFLRHVQVLLCKISTVCRLKYACSCFSSHFSFQVVVLLIIVLFLGFFLCNSSFFFLFNVIFESSYQCIDLILNADKSSPSFFSFFYSLSVPSLRCKALYIVISFLVFWSIHQSYSSITRWLLFYFFESFFFPLALACPIGWCCIIHRLLLCRCVKLPIWVSWIMTLSNLMTRSWPCWSFGEWGATLHCHYTLIHSVLQW